jgi:hypothetical protein
VQLSIKSYSDAIRQIPLAGSRTYPGPRGLHASLIPGAGYTYWVKQLVEGQVAELPQEYIPGQTPFVTEVYASPAQGQEDTMGPIHSLLGWLWSLLTGPAAHYGTLLKHIEVTTDWGLVGEVLQFHQLEHHLCNLCLRITHLEAKTRGVSQAQLASKGRLELAHLDYFTLDLRVLTGLESREGQSSQQHSKQWRGMNPF